MTIRNLNFLFAPSSVALIGVGKTTGTLADVVTNNLFKAGFAGICWFKDKMPSSANISFAVSELYYSAVFGTIYASCCQRRRKNKMPFDEA